MSKRDREVSNMAKIREIVNRHINLGSLACYNDKRIGYRRMKFMWNGFQFSPLGYRRILTKIIRDLNKANVLYNDVDWINCTSWRGPYKALAVYVPLTRI